MPIQDKFRLAAEAARGFMPPEEGLALYRTAALYAPAGPIGEVGTYCGKSTIYLAAAAAEAGQFVVTVDHHHGSEETPGRAGSITTRRSSIPEPAGWTRCRSFGRRSRTRTRGRASSPWSASRPTWPGCGGPRSGCCSSTAGTARPTWSPTTRAGRHGWRAAGALAFHDVFPDPADGGQAPYRVYQRALASGAFKEVSVTGSLRVLERIGAGIG